MGQISVRTDVFLKQEMRRPRRCQGGRMFKTLGASTKKKEKAPFSLNFNMVFKTTDQNQPVFNAVASKSQKIMGINIDLQPQF